jgi:hypothetical protein
MLTEDRSGTRPLGPWLLLLCALLLGWAPASFALTASTLVDSLAVRGVGVTAFLALRLLVVAVGIAAGLALLGRRPAARALAAGALCASLGTDLLDYLSGWFPSNRIPGTTWMYVTATLTYHLAWLTYLFRLRDHN